MVLPFRALPEASGSILKNVPEIYRSSCGNRQERQRANDDY